MKSSLLAKLWLFMNARSATEEAHADTSALHWTLSDKADYRRLKPTLTS